MEEEAICYLKRMPNGKIRIFKKVYCCFGIGEWRNCPEYFCRFWPSNGSECPRNPGKDVTFKGALDDIEIIKVEYKNRKDEALSGT